MERQNQTGGFEQRLRLRGLSRRTVQAYVLHAEKYRQSGLDPKDYLERLARTRDPRTVNLAVAAIKSYFRTLGQDIELSYLKRPKRLPEVLTPEEVIRMLDAVKNPKHQLLLDLLYGCGLRVSEARNLRKEDIRLQEGLLFVRQGKGNKDRIVPLPAEISHKLQPFLAEEDCLFVLQSERGGRLHMRTIQQVVKQAAKKAGIRKHVHPHTLRHSYATHLLEGGTDLKIIQRLLGHSSVKATEIYTHVSAATIKSVVSPLDRLVGKTSSYPPISQKHL